jgi:hypothetical protein
MRDLVLACEALYLAIRGEDASGVWLTLERLSAAVGEHGRFSATPAEPSVWRASIGESPDIHADHEGVGDDPDGALRALFAALAAVVAGKRDALSAAIERATESVS